MQSTEGMHVKAAAGTYQEADAAHELQGGPPSNPGVVQHEVAGDGCIDDPDQGDGQGGDDGGSADLQARRAVVLSPATERWRTCCCMW